MKYSTIHLLFIRAVVKILLSAISQNESPYHEYNTRKEDSLKVTFIKNKRTTNHLNRHVQTGQPSSRAISRQSLLLNPTRLPHLRF